VTSANQSQSFKIN